MLKGIQPFPFNFETVIKADFHVFSKQCLFTSENIVYKTVLVIFGILRGPFLLFKTFPSKMIA